MKLGGETNTQILDIYVIRYEGRVVDEMCDRHQDRPAVCYYSIGLIALDLCAECDEELRSRHDEVALRDRLKRDAMKRPEMVTA